MESPAICGRGSRRDYGNALEMKDGILVPGEHLKDAQQGMEAVALKGELPRGVLGNVAENLTGFQPLGTHVSKQRSIRRVWGHAKLQSAVPGCIGGGGGPNISSRKSPCGIQNKPAGQ
jgi:hypothetical protein